MSDDSVNIIDHVLEETLATANPEYESGIMKTGTNMSEKDRFQINLNGLKANLEAIRDVISLLALDNTTKDALDWIVKGAGIAGAIGSSFSGWYHLSGSAGHAAAHGGAHAALAAHASWVVPGIKFSCGALAVVGGAAMGCKYFYTKYQNQQ